MQTISPADVIALAAATFFSIALSSLALVKLAPRISRMLMGLEGKKLNALIFLYICALLLITSGPPGLLVASVATAIGVLPPLLGVRRTHLMGLILLPSLLRYAGIG